MMYAGLFCLFLFPTFYFGGDLYAADKSKDVRYKHICPADSFEKFANLFLNDRFVQKKFTQYPLAIQYLDTSKNSEPEFIGKKIKKNENWIKYIVLMSDWKGLKYVIDSPEYDRPNIKVYEDDTDFLIVYKFKKKNCWYLVSVEDRSL